MNFLRKILLGALALFIGNAAAREVQTRFDIDNIIGVDQQAASCDDVSYVAQKIDNHVELLHTSKTETGSAGDDWSTTSCQFQALTYLGPIKAEAVQPPSSNSSSSNEVVRPVSTKYHVFRGNTLPQHITASRALLADPIGSSPSGPGHESSSSSLSSLSSSVTSASNASTCSAEYIFISVPRTVTAAGAPGFMATSASSGSSGSGQSLGSLPPCIPNDYLIVFPVDGHQPTTEEAVQWSCANVTDDAITELYVQLFGLTPLQSTGTTGNYIKAGLDRSGRNPCRIMTIDFQKFLDELVSSLKSFGNFCQSHLIPVPSLCTRRINEITQYSEIKTANEEDIQKLIIELSDRTFLNNVHARFPIIDSQFGYNLLRKLKLLLIIMKNIIKNSPITAHINIETLATEFEKLFIGIFKKIAKTSVGRTLLYRILLKILRRENLEKKGCFEANDLITYNEKDITLRNISRSIRINYGEFAYSWGKLTNSSISEEATIFIRIDPILIPQVGRNFRDLYEIKCEAVDACISFFHELIHWFHWLRDNHRASSEFFPSPNSIYESDLWKTYFDHSDTINKQSSLKNKRQIDVVRFNLEEIRTILGMPNKLNGVSLSSHQKTYLPGDDLCENLFRTCLGVPLRYGYTYGTFYADSRIVDSVISTCKTNILPYKHCTDHVRSTRSL